MRHKCIPKEDAGIFRGDTLYKQGIAIGKPE